MADKNKKDGSQVVKPSSSPVFIWKAILAILVLILLAGGGFAAGVFLNLFDTEQLASDWKLHEKPIIGGFFPKPSVTSQTSEIIDGPLVANSQIQSSLSQGAAKPIASKSEPKLPVATPEEMEKLIKMQKEEEAKRIGKLARLYASMKPEEAVPILNELDDTTVISILTKMEEEQVAKILIAFDAKRSARITQAMFRGQPKYQNTLNTLTVERR